jgi:hypothetical protein
MLGFNGGLMGVRRTPTTGTASGLWFQNEQSVAQRAGIWPISGGVNINAITYSQSSVYSGTDAATNAAMTDGLQTGAQTATGAGSNGTPWLKMDLQNLFTIDRVVIGNASGSVPAGGWSAAYTNNLDLQYSTDDTNWTTIVDTGDKSANSFLYTISFTAVSARYVRLINNHPTNNKHIALTEFYALSPGQASP